jgi:hypothetical protein
MSLPTTSPTNFYIETIKRAFRGKFLLAEAVAGFFALLVVPAWMFFYPTTSRAP